MKLRSRAALALAAVAALPLPGRAGGYASSGADFLKIPVGARPAALGGANSVTVLNPGGESSPLAFDVLGAGAAVKIFSVSGRLVKSLDAPSGTARWDLTSDGGGAAASGYYLYLITGPNGSRSGRLALIR